MRESADRCLRCPAAIVRAGDSVNREGTHIWEGLFGLLTHRMHDPYLGGGLERIPADRRSPARERAVSGYIIRRGGSNLSGGLTRAAPFKGVFSPPVFKKACYCTLSCIIALFCYKGHYLDLPIALFAARNWAFIRSIGVSALAFRVGFSHTFLLRLSTLFINNY